MRTNLCLGLVAVVVGAGLWLGSPARSQLPAPTPPPLPRELAAAAKLEEKDVEKVLTVLGPELSRQIAAGRQVAIRGLGTFRVVRLSESRNLADGRVVVQPARNVIEFVPDAALDQAANSPGAVPAAEVPAFQYVPFPGQTPGQKVPAGRSPSTRVR